MVTVELSAWASKIGVTLRAAEARGQGSGKARQGKADENWTIPKANIKRIVSAKLAEVQGEKKFQVCWRR